MAFKTISPQVDFPELEKKLLDHWYSSGLVEKYLHRNDKSVKKFSFLDGPMTANNPMGVHHAWGRTYKDLWQRFYTSQGYKGRYQNGFDCQGLWVEVEVEKELGFKSKKDIESYGIANFVNRCKERVLKYASIQTEQSKKLGYFMDWENSYFTMSDENNYAIWDFLKICWERGWMYKGHDSVPWCPRCETAISQHEMLTEDYKELTHETVFFKLPVLNKGFSLVAWTTTPWTIPANVALAVNPNFFYKEWKNKLTGEHIVILREDSLPERENPDEYENDRKFLLEVLKGEEWEGIKDYKGSDLVGLKYSAPFDDLSRVEKAKLENPEIFHTVVSAPELVVATKGTGILHIAPGAGEEDFNLGKELGLPLINVIQDNADYLDEMGEFSGKNAKKHPEIIIDHLKTVESGKFLHKTMRYTHRYPACWRCKTELVWKVADEWYIAMDKKDPTDKKELTLRQQMIEVAKTISWIPHFGLDRELDWLKNMHDWLISKKNRYWGLALPIYECNKCSSFEVIGSKEELKKRAIVGWEKFDGNTPHRPWIDEVKIACKNCSGQLSRIADVGNPWLDAGIVSISTLPDDWFPADFITESFPGQFKNWFYALIAMSTVLKKEKPFKTVLGFATLLDEKGRPMHKSSGNSIEFTEGADKMGVDVMRWVYVNQRPENNLLFGYKLADETRRRFHLMLWNCYNFFVTYANLDNISREKLEVGLDATATLDQWIIARLKETSIQVKDFMSEYSAHEAAQAIEIFASDFSTWYIRRSRDRVGPSIDESEDKLSFYKTSFYVLSNLAIIMAPFQPFISEEIYTNITGKESVHLENWPEFVDLSTEEDSLLEEMQTARIIVEKAHAERKSSAIKTRQPLNSLTYFSDKRLEEKVEKIIAQEVNVKQLKWSKSQEMKVELDKEITPELLAEGKARDLVRSIQEMRKAKGLKLNELAKARLPEWPEEFEEYIKSQALLSSIEKGTELELFS
jgi:isoleucyl-tRNA synthetase